MNDFGLDLAVIRNGRTAALVEPSSRIVRWCHPRFDGDPIFSRLLAGGEAKGFCDVVLQGMVDFSSEYVRNTAIVSTVLTDRKGASIRITDFAPRFREYNRIFRPPQLMRIIAHGRRSGRKARCLHDRQRAVASRDRAHGNPRSPLRAHRGSDRT